MTLTINAMTAVGGADVTGIDLTAPLDAAAVAELEAAFLSYGVLRFRDQPLNARQLADFAAHFGSLQPHVQRAYQHPEVPEVVRMTNRKADGSFDEVGARRGAIENTRDGWHADLSYDPIPAKATLLHSLVVPSRGGNTCFSNTRLAFEALPYQLKTALLGLEAEFDYGGHRRNASTSIAASALDREGRQTARAVHPVITAHPQTGAPGIYVNPLMTTRVLGVSEVQSEAILEQLFDLIDDPSVRFEHEWRVGDTLMWDNRGCLMHTGRLDYPREEAREFIRTTIRGTSLAAFRYG